MGQRKQTWPQKSGRESCVLRSTTNSGGECVAITAARESADIKTINTRVFRDKRSCSRVILHHNSNLLLITKALISMHMVYGKQSGRLSLKLSWLSLPQCSEQCEQNNEIKKVIISPIIARRRVQYPSMHEQKKVPVCSSKGALKVDQRTQNKTESLYGSTHKPFNTVKLL